MDEARSFTGVDLYFNPQDLTANFLLVADNVVNRQGQLYVRPGLVGLFGGNAPSSSSSSSQSGSQSSSSSSGQSSSSSSSSTHSSSSSSSAVSSSSNSSSSHGPSSSSSSSSLSQSSSSSSSGVSSSSSSTPYPTSGLLIYLDSRVGTGVSPGNPVTTWLDQSGNANNAVTYSGNAVLTATIFGSQPGVNFGAGITMRIPYNAALGVTEMTIAVALQWNTGASTWQNFFSRRNGGSASLNWQLGFGPTTGSQYNEFNGTRSLYDPASLSNGDQRLFMMTGDGAGTNLYRSTTILNSDVNAPYNNAGITNDVTIGDSALGNAENFYGYLGAVMMWNRILDSTEMSQVASYLNTAFGVS